jgi:hypothetical protein
LDGIGSPKGRTGVLERQLPLDPNGAEYSHFLVKVQHASYGRLNG